MAKIVGHYSKENERYLENCTQCGACAKGCPILPYTDARDFSFSEIQQGVFDFTATGIPNPHAYTKAFACMECFKCTQKMCPEGLNPLLINELIKGDYIARVLAGPPYKHAGLPDSVHRVLESIQVGGSDYERVVTATEKRDARCVFFPGCNVYFHPDKILNAMDILDRVGDAHAFLPGLDYCCGSFLHPFYSKNSRFFWIAEILT